MAVYRSKYSYQQAGKRRQITTTVNEEILDKFIQLSLESGQPRTKMMDIALMQIFESEETLDNFMKKVKEY